MSDSKLFHEIIVFCKLNESPIAWGLSAVFVFFLFWRKFTTTEYVTAGKTAFESLSQLCQRLEDENKNLAIDVKIIQERLDQCQLIIQQLKKDKNTQFDNIDADKI